MDEGEVLDELAGGFHGLGADAGAAGGEVGELEGGDEFLQGGAEEAAAPGAADFLPAHGLMLGHEAPEAGEGEGVEEVAGVEVLFAVAFAGPGEDGVRPGLDAAVDEAGEVDAEEGEAGVGDGVDEVADEGVALGAELVVFAAKGDDFDGAGFAGEGGDAVGVEAGAVDEVIGVDISGGGWGFDPPAGAVGGDFFRAAVKFEGAPEFFDFDDEAGADLGVIDDAFLGDVEGCEAADVGLDFEHFFALEEAEAGEAVGGAAFVEAVEAFEFGFVGGDDEFAADFVGDGVGLAEGDHFADAGDGEPGLEGAGLVVEAGVEDAAVVAGLVLAGAALFFEEGDGGAGTGEEEFVGGGETDDAAADDGVSGGHGSGLGAGIDFGKVVSGFAVAAGWAMLVGGGPKLLAAPPKLGVVRTARFAEWFGLCQGSSAVEQGTHN